LDSHRNADHAIPREHSTNHHFTLPKGQEGPFARTSVRNVAIMLVCDFPKDGHAAQFRQRLRPVALPKTRPSSAIGWDGPYFWMQFRC
jgi:hypothetical protein